MYGMRSGLGVTTVDACTCVNNVCQESGNDCIASSGPVSTPTSLLPAGWMPTNLGTGGLSTNMLLAIGGGAVLLLFLAKR